MLKISVYVAILLAASGLFGQYSATYTDFPKSNWVLVGFPLTPVYQNPDSVLGPFFGGSQGNDNNTENTLWRFSRWSAAYDTYFRWGELDRDTNGTYSNLGEPTTIIPGWGYWFNQNNADTSLTIAGAAASTAESYSIKLDPPQNGHRGRTMVANPFIFPIDWKNTEVLIRSEDEGIEMSVSLLEANEMGLLDQYAYPWNAGLISSCAAGGYVPYNATDGGVLPAWQGFWVEQLNNEIYQLITYKVEHTGGDNVCKFHTPVHGGHNEKDYLGADGITETDRFVIAVVNPENNVDVLTRARGNATVTFTSWPTLSVGTTLTTANGFDVTLVSAETNGDTTVFIFDVTATLATQLGWQSSLQHILFTFGSNKHVTNVIYPGAPNHGNNEDPYTSWSQSGNGNASSYTALRKIHNTWGTVTDIEMTLLIPPTEVTPLKKGLAHSPVSVVSTTSDRDWIMPISISTVSGAASDSYNAIGILSNASDSYDINDVTQQTPPDAYLEIYFPHNDVEDLLNYWYERPVNVCYDMRSDSSHKEWKMAVAAYQISNQPCKITWDASAISSEWSLQLLDADYNVICDDMKSVSEYNFTTGSASFSKQIFHISAIFLPTYAGIINPEIPEDFQLLRNYPNPFNANTTIQYSVKNTGYTTVRIYSSNGTLVKTLVSDNLPPNTYTAFWDGRNETGNPVATGLYICQVRNVNSISAIKIALIK
jgi:hypothetical protein